MTLLPESLVAEMLRTARTDDALLEEAQMIQFVSGANEQTRLTNLYKQRRDEIRGVE